jgi:hypothetical protein
MSEIAFLLYGNTLDARDAFQEDKYKLLAEYFKHQGVHVNTVCYCDDNKNQVEQILLEMDFTIVWINPIEAGMNRTTLDAMLNRLAQQGKKLSSLPETILKIGTKKVLFETSDFPWGSDVRLYKTVADFKNEFPISIQTAKTRILKQYRGDGGKGVFKIEWLDTAKPSCRVTPAVRGSDTRVLSLEALTDFMSPFFENGNPVIDQEWNQYMLNGIVRCYMTGQNVVGFGYQEVNALYPIESNHESARKRNYYTENCGMFKDLRLLMETTILPALFDRYNIQDNQSPIIWDADFFINDAPQKYTLCEINASCVSPFPESAIPHIYQEVIKRTQPATN